MNLQFRSKEKQERFQETLVEELRKTVKNNSKIQFLLRQGDEIYEKSNLIEKLFDEAGSLVFDKIIDHFVKSSIYQELFNHTYGCTYQKGHHLEKKIS